MTENEFITTAPLPENEFHRLLELSELELDYTSLQEEFKDLAVLAAGIAGTEISLINLIDSSTQWSISTFGITQEQTPREDTICQYTICEEDFLQIEDLAEDDRFNQAACDDDVPPLRYYLGVPLQTENGSNIGTLCVVDTRPKTLGTSQINSLKILSGQIVKRFKSLKKIEDLTRALENAGETQKKVAHDIRGPLVGIGGLCDILNNADEPQDRAEAIEIVAMIRNGAQSVLELSMGILNSDPGMLPARDRDLRTIKQKLEKLYIPQARNKDIELKINLTDSLYHLAIPGIKIIQIVGNLITNAIKYSENDSIVEVSFARHVTDVDTLTIRVEDKGRGMSSSQVAYIENEAGQSTPGTLGEQGFGLGLRFVVNLISILKGKFSIQSKLDEGTVFQIDLPLAINVDSN